MADNMKYTIVDPVNKFDRGTVIKVFGVGGAGGNAVEHMIVNAVEGVEFIVANTDSQALAQSSAPLQIALGESGLGAGAKPERGKEAAEGKIDEIRSALQGANMVFITAGMGGGTGTGAAPVVASVAREMGILTVGVVTKPFRFEGPRRMRTAEQGIEALGGCVDSLLVVLNDKLIEVLGEDASSEDCFHAADDVLKKAVGGIVEIITSNGLINVDFEDVRTVMSSMGRAMMGTATASGVDRARVAAEQAIASPLLEGVNLSTAGGILINISGSRATMKAKESYEVMDVVQKLARGLEDEHIICGQVFDETLGDELRVTVIATGLNSRATPEVVAGAGSRTGTDDLPDFSNVESPAVNRRHRRSSTVSSMTAQTLANSGVDHYAIPTFLRKQAD